MLHCSLWFDGYLVASAGHSVASAGYLVASVGNADVRARKPANSVAKVTGKCIVGWSVAVNRPRRVLVLYSERCVVGWGESG